MYIPSLFLPPDSPLAVSAAAIYDDDQHLKVSCVLAEDPRAWHSSSLAPLTCECVQLTSTLGGKNWCHPFSGTTCAVFFFFFQKYIYK